MDKVFRGSTFKNWFLNKPDVRRVLKPKDHTFYLFKSLDEIDDHKYYLMKYRDYTEVVLIEVDLVI
ncbi:hypothetical protein BpsM61_00032 [Bacillus phage vB_BpsM-61]|nr:hypothetical protein BpsM61_00032 [Bacillus phage vB_BpsM-61]